MFVVSASPNALAPSSPTWLSEHIKTHHTQRTTHTCERCSDYVDNGCCGEYRGDTNISNKLISPHSKVMFVYFSNRKIKLGDVIKDVYLNVFWENAPFGHIHDWRSKLIKVQHPGVVARRVDVTTLIIYFTWLVWWCRIPSEFADTPRDSSWVIIENIYLLHVCVCVCVVHCVMGDV